MNCPNCGEILTEEMKETGICFSCGCNIQEISERNMYRATWNQDSSSDKGKYFKYKTVRILDKPDGSTDTEEIENTLNKLGFEGWRLVSILSNELGKNSESLTLSGVTTGTNATIDETILIFERIVLV